MYIDKSFFIMVGLVIVMTGGAIFLIRSMSKPPKKK